MGQQYEGTTLGGTTIRMNNNWRDNNSRGKQLDGTMEVPKFETTKSGDSNRRQ